jgi:hypothetical protein
VVATFTDAAGNFQNSSGSLTQTVNKTNTLTSVSSLLNPSAFGQAVALTVTVTNVGGSTGTGTGSGGPSTATPTGAVNFTIDGGAPTAATPATCPSGTPAYSVCFTASTSSLNAGPHSVVATFTDAAGNFQNSSGSLTQTVNKVDAVVSVTPYGVTFDGNPHTATGTVTGAGGVSLSGLNLSGTTHTNVGTYTDTWVFTDMTGNYNNSSGTLRDAIAKASAAANVMPYNVTFDGNPHTATGTVTGAGGLSLSGLNLSGTTHTNAGTYPDTWSFTDTTGNYNNLSGTVSDVIGKATPVVSVSTATAQYSDYASFTASVGAVGGQMPTGTVQFYLNNSAVGSAVGVNSSGVATLPQIQISLGAGSYPVKAVFSSTNTNFVGSSGSATQTVTQEEAFVLYSGNMIAQAGTPLTLRATVWDSAAAGYPGTNPETGATIGDITKMWVAFDTYPAGNCGSGTPSTVYAQVALTSTAGVGTATATLNSTSEASYCLISHLVAGSAGGTNLFYIAPDAEPVGVDFYVNSGQFATGGGWVNDSTGSHGNFGFNARYNASGSPKGQIVYVFRGTYNGVLADFIIKSNALSGLQFSGTTYPISATLQGKANVQVNRASDGLTLFSAGNYTFSATVTDSGQNGPVGKQFSLTVYDPSGVPYHSVPAGTPLQGGDVKVHQQ